jgi:crotonobetainyl-CoA:carnitine CoA-transferase CaiB-like acyl-CoA transferase
VLDRTLGMPLANVRVVSVEQFGAGPFATLILADQGAEVIKVEDPGTDGDVARRVPPLARGGDSLYFEYFNRGKKSIAIDLKSAAGREVFEKLVATADAVLSNVRGDQQQRLGLTYAQLAHTNPRIVCVALTAYGRGGDRAMLPGYDALIQAEAGWAAITGDPDGPPTKTGPSLVDYIGGLMAAVALLTGVIEARRTGSGRDIDTSLYDCALATIGYPATWFLSTGRPNPRVSLSAHPSIVPFQFFRTVDGYVAVACPKEKFFTALVRALGLAPLADDPRFSSFDVRERNRAALLAILEERFSSRRTNEWVELLRGRVPIAPVRRFDEALSVTELASRQMLSEYEHPSLGTVRSVGSPIRLHDRSPLYARGPRFREHNRSLLAELGYDGPEIVELAQRGAFGEQETPGSGGSTQ